MVSKQCKYPMNPPLCKSKRYRYFFWLLSFSSDGYPCVPRDWNSMLHGMEQILAICFYPVPWNPDETRFPLRAVESQSSQTTYSSFPFSLAKITVNKIPHTIWYQRKFLVDFVFIHQQVGYVWIQQITQFRFPIPRRFRKPEVTLLPKAQRGSA